MQLTFCYPDYLTGERCMREYCGRWLNLQAHYAIRRMKMSCTIMKQTIQLMLTKPGSIGMFYDRLYHPQGLFWVGEKGLVHTDCTCARLYPQSGYIVYSRKILSKIPISNYVTFSYHTRVWSTRTWDKHKEFVWAVNRQATSKTLST